MIELNLTATTPEEQTVLENLIPQVNETLAEKINNGVYIEKGGKTLLNKKDLTAFMIYAEEQAKNLIAENQRKGAKAVCVHGNDIMNWAIHYFEEDSIEGKLYNEDGTEYVPPKPAKTTSVSSAPITPPKPKDTQTSLFDMINTASDISETADTEDDGEELNNDYTPAELEEAANELKNIKSAQLTEKCEYKGSPMYQHYLSVKEKYKDCLVFYRLGDFYEMFGDDAVTAAKELDLTLTGRDCGLKERVPMVGVPFHAVDKYLSKLVAKDYKVVICERLESEETVERVIAKQPNDNRPVDIETGEILNCEEETDEELITVSKLIGETPDETEAPDLLDIRTDDFDIEKERQAAKAFDVEALIILQDIFGNEMTVC